MSKDDPATKDQRHTLPDPAEPLPVDVADSHCHLDLAAQVTGLDPEDAIRQAAAVGITRIAQIGCDAAGSRWAVDLAARTPSVIAGVALHPNDAARLVAEQGRSAFEEAWTEIEGLAGAHDRVRAVGETGLDHFRTTDEAGRAVQRESFARHIQLARQHGLTLVIHDRDAHAEILDVLDAEGGAERIVMHCFSGDADFARACLDRGAWLSFPGTVTFKPNEHLREALRISPLDRLLTETDAPYLTPMPHRGRPNASFLIPHTVRFMAGVRGDDVADLCRALDAGTSAAFGGDWDRAAFTGQGVR
ncbi:MAG: TatD family hydrolase [Propionibacteriaceae bacterium]